MTISDEILATYYDARALASGRHEAAMHAEPGARTPDPLHVAFDVALDAQYRERLGSLRGLAVGEVGVGSGDTIELALAHGARTIVMIDISRACLDAVVEKLNLTPDGEHVKLIVADAKRLDGIADGELDVLVAREVIEHLTDFRPFLRECRRVLRAGGTLYLTTPNRNCIDLWPRIALSAIVPPPKLTGDPLVRKVFGHLYDYLTPNEIGTLARTLPPGFKEHIHEFAPGELLAELRAHDLNPVRYWGTPPHLFYNELRPLAPRMFPAWTQAEHLSYAFGDDLRVLAKRV